MATRAPEKKSAGTYSNDLGSFIESLGIGDELAAALSTVSGEEERAPAKQVLFQQFQAPSVAGLGSVLDQTARRVLGRKATDEEKRLFSSLIRSTSLSQQDRAFQAQLSAAQQEFSLNYPQPTAPEATGIFGLPMSAVNQLTADAGRAIRTTEFGYGQASRPGLKFNPKDQPVTRAGMQHIWNTWGVRSAGYGQRATKSEHPSGFALDAMTSDRRLGDTIANDFVQNALARGVKYIIWNRQIYTTTGPNANRWRPYRGKSPHTDHVHISFFGGPHDKPGERPIKGPATPTPKLGEPGYSAAEYVTGATVTTEQIDAEAEAERLLRERAPAEAGAHDISSQFDSFLKLIGAR